MKLLATIIASLMMLFTMGTPVLACQDAVTRENEAVSISLETALSLENETPTSDGKSAPNYALFIVGSLLLIGVFGGGKVLKRRNSGRTTQERDSLEDDDE